MESPERVVRIVNIRFSQFKALQKFSISLDGVNILVGPNNSGKSTVIGALRALASGLRLARSRSPEYIEIDSGRVRGYRISDDNLPISLENVHTNYDSIESRISFLLSNKNKLHLVFPINGGCVLVPETDGVAGTTVAAFKKNFPISIAVVPVLGPVEHKEERRERNTVTRAMATHRASRHFRSYWHYNQEGFEDFARLVESTWPGMEIQPPEIVDVMENELGMFCRENRIAREIYWVGFGFQIWCQLLTHITHARGATIVVVDEPEVYLHPDVQRQLLGILRGIGSDVLLATHSTEIMAEADPSEIILIDKRKNFGQRLKDIDGVQLALSAIGSIQNITLSTLAKNRRVLFVEGSGDFVLLRRFSNRLGLKELGASLGITSLESGGFGSWSKITTLASGISDALGASLMIGAIYDRDYFSDEEIQAVTAALCKSLALAHVHQRKEIENYLLIPSSLQRAVERAIADRISRVGEDLPSTIVDVAAVLRRITDAMRDDVQSQLIARRTNYLRSTGRDVADITRETLAWFSTRWENFDVRLEIVPGKEVLRQFREEMQATYNISLTDVRIIETMRKEEIPNDLRQLLEALDEFRKKNM